METLVCPEYILTLMELDQRVLEPLVTLGVRCSFCTHLLSILNLYREALTKDRVDDNTVPLKTMSQKCTFSV